jgi:Rrf2 family protein
MRLTKASAYAIRCVQYLSIQKKGAVASCNEIAGAMDIPRDFLSKIAQQLSRSNILDIIKGPKGGYRLQMPPEQLTLLDVIETMMGDIFFNECALRPESCSKSCTCQLYPVWVKARKQFRETLRQATFAQLIREVKECSVSVETAVIE